MSAVLAPSPLLAAWQRGDASATELTQLALAAIERLNPALNAVITAMPEQALARAAALDGTAKRAPLHGMPVTLKDNIDYAGVRCTVASDFFAERVAPEHAEVTRRLEAAGAVVVGKANLHEFVLGATGQSERFGPCRNPWHPEHVPGGSSSGSGASVAAGFCVASLGSDTGGSIRNPACFNGVAGLKATHGRVSNRGSFPVSPGYDCIGPLAARVEDLARVHQAIAGYDPEDASSEDRPPGPAPSTPADLHGVVIGLPRGFYFEGLHPEVAAGVEAAMRTLAEAGAGFREVHLNEADEAWRLASRVLVMADAAALHRERMEREPARMGADVRARVTPGREVSGMHYAEALRFKERWRVQIRRVFAACDLLLTPTCPFPAPRLAECADMGRTSNKINRFNFTWSLAGVPALSLPCGISAEGLPYAFQLVAPWWQEARLLEAGLVYQALTDWHLRTPRLLREAGA